MQQQQKKTNYFAEFISKKQPTPAKPEYPTPLKEKVDKWIADKLDTCKPRVVHLKDASEFCSSKHLDKIIEFPPGGKVGDREWNLQYMHNTSVLIDYNRRRNPNPNVACQYYIVLHRADYHADKLRVNVYVNEILLDRQELTWLTFWNDILDIKPNIAVLPPDLEIPPALQIESEAETNMYDKLKPPFPRLKAFFMGSFGKCDYLSLPECRVELETTDAILNLEASENRYHDLNKKTQTLTIYQQDYCCNF